MRFAMIPLAVAAASCGGVEAKLTCEGNADCLDGYGCDSTASGAERICLRQCTGNPDCLASQTCDTTAGLCRRQECGAGETNCGGACVNVNTSTSHCGACDNACAATAVCDTGTCRCGGAGGGECTAKQGDVCSGITCLCGVGTACTPPTVCVTPTCS